MREQRKKKSYKERKSSSELPSLSVTWHQAWVAGYAHRHCTLSLLNNSLQAVPELSPEPSLELSQPPSHLAKGHEQL